MKLSVSVLVNTSGADAILKQTKIVCFIMTMDENILTKGKSINDTWGKRCDKLLFINSAKSKLPNTLWFNLPEGRNHLTGKTMAAIKYLYANHLNDYDWFMKADDDTYVVMENLKFLLSKLDKTKPMYLGNHFKLHVKQGYMSGGAGYIFSRKALQVLTENAIYKGEHMNYIILVQHKILALSFQSCSFLKKSLYSM